MRRDLRFPPSRDFCTRPKFPSPHPGLPHGFGRPFHGLKPVANRPRRIRGESRYASFDAINRNVRPQTNTFLRTKFRGDSRAQYTHHETCAFDDALPGFECSDRRRERWSC